EAPDRERNVQHGDEVVSPPLEDLVRFHVHTDVQVAGRPAGATCVTAARDPELEPVGHPGGDLNGDELLLLNPSVAPALPAPIDDLLAGPLARPARPSGHHRPEQAALHVLDLAGPTAPPAPG